VGAWPSTAGFVTLICAINFSGTQLDWGNGGIIALFVTSSASWVLSAGQQWFNIFTSRENRLLPVHVLV
jgi:hypothetical protein